MTPREIREKTSGFTLVEIMIVVFIVSVIGAALFMSLSSGRKTWASADTQISLQQDLRKAMSQITLEIRDSGESQFSCLATGTPCTSVSFNVSQ